MSSYKLIYFTGRGRAETIRMLFALAGVEFVDQRVTQEEWAKIKPTTLFGQIPVLYVDGNEIAQSRTIIRFLGRRFGFAGKTEMEQTKVDMLLETVEDLLQQIIKCYHAKGETKESLLKDLVEEHLPRRCGYFEKYLIANGGGDGYLVGNSITCADINLANGLTWIEYLDLNPTYDFSVHPKLHSLCYRVFSEPRIGEWMKRRPQTNPW